MSKKLTIEEIKRKLKEVHGDVITLDELTYTIVRAKAKFVDKDYGEWWASPDNVINKKRNHPHRAMLTKKQTNLKKYGCEYPLQNEDVKAKMRITSLERYGVEYPAQNTEIYSKVEQTNVKKYGAKNPMQNKEVQEKTKQTNVKKYGAKNPMQTKEIASKSARNQYASIVLYHWQTGEELICTASYEQKVVQYLNKNKINYKWKPQGFKLPNGKMYFPDLYLTDIDTWAEIKGYFRKDAKEKWDMFCKEYPNSELWDYKKLKQLGIIK